VEVFAHSFGVLLDPVGLQMGVAVGEAFKQLRWGQRRSALQLLEGAGDGGGQPAEPVAFTVQPPLVAA